MLYAQKPRALRLEESHMPLNPQIFGTSILTAGTSVGLVGSDFSRLANAIGDGVCKSLLVPGVLTSTLIGVSGVGVITGGPVIVVPLVLQADIGLAMSSFGIVGSASQQLAAAVALGISQAMVSATVVGTCPLVSTGGGTAFMANYTPPFLFSLLTSSATMYGLVGSEVPRIMNALATGISNNFLKVIKVPLVVAGPPIPPPPAGPLPSAGPGIVNFL